MDVSDDNIEKELDRKILLIVRILAMVFPEGGKDEFIIPENIFKKKSKFKLTRQYLTAKVYKLIDKMVIMMKKILCLIFPILILFGCSDYPYDKENDDVMSNEEFTQVLADVGYDSRNTEIGFFGADTITTVTGNLTLPTIGENGTDIVWKSLNTVVISNSGIVTRQVGNVDVTLIAYVSKHDITGSKIFYLTVLSL